MPRQPVHPTKPAKSGRRGSMRSPAHSEPDVPRLLFTVQEAAHMLGIGQTLMYRLIERDEIDSIKIGRLRRLTREALDAFAARKSTTDSAS